MKSHTSAKPSGPPEWLVMTLGIPIGSFILAVIVAIVARRVRFWWTHGRHYSRMHRRYVHKYGRGD
jgi:hypothetical protein